MEPKRVATPPQSPHTGPAAHTSRNKASTQATPDAASGGTGGFLSLLSALDDSLNAVVDDVMGAATDAALLPADEAPLLPTDAAALMALLAGNIPPAPAGQGGGDALKGAQGASTLSLGQGAATLAALQAELLPPGGLVAQTARLDGAADKAALEGQNPMAGYKRAFSRLQTVLSTSVAGASTAALAAGQRSAVGEKPGMPTALMTSAGSHAVPERRDAVLAGTALPRNGLEVAAAPTLIAQAATAASPEAAALVRATGDKATPDGLTDVWGAAHAGPEAASAPDAATALAEPNQTAAEDALAEQVAYWVSENLQNAELTVTHNGQPVEVSVSMSGKEAHIVFGSDQSETRDLIDASLAQLRELLHSEGLILSGVTVGESSARNADSDGSGDASRGRQGGRQAQMLVPVAEAGAPRVNVLTDRAVDLFV